MLKQSVKGKAAEDLQISAGELKGEQKRSARLQQFPRPSQSLAQVRGNTSKQCPRHREKARFMASISKGGQKVQSLSWAITLDDRIPNTSNPPVIWCILKPPYQGKAELNNTFWSLAKRVTKIKERSWQETKTYRWRALVAGEAHGSWAAPLHGLTCAPARGCLGIAPTAGKLICSNVLHHLSKIFSFLPSHDSCAAT